MPVPSLYDAILSRTSVRRYDERPLDAETHRRVQEAIARIKPLSSISAFGLVRRDGVSGQELSAVLGFYGHLIGAPHCLIPHLVDSDWPLVELGFRLEQIAVLAWEAASSACWATSLPRSLAGTCLLERALAQC